MKKFLVLTLLLGSLGVSADHHVDDKMTFEESKSCVSKSKDKAELQDCKKKMWGERKDMKDKKNKWKDLKKKK
jgi:hypothetical protein